MKKITLVFLLIAISAFFIFSDTTEIKNFLKENLNNEVVIYVKNIQNYSVGGILTQVLNDTIVINSNDNNTIYIQIDSIAGFVAIKGKKKK